jgi:hypothetical protein
MPKSLKKSLNQWPSWHDHGAAASATRARARQPGQEFSPPGSMPQAIYSVRESTQGTSFARKVISIPVGFGFKVLLGSKCATAITAGVLLYFFAAFIGNEWLYLLASGFFVAPLLGTIFPLLMLLLIRADLSIPRELVVGEAAKFVVKLKRRGPRGLFARLLPVRCFELGVNVVRRGLDGNFSEVVAAEIIPVDSLFNESQFEFSTASLRRGIYQIREIFVISSFPFGIVSWKKTLRFEKSSSSMTVYPLVRAVAGNFLEHLPGLPALMGITTSNMTARHNSTFYRNIREFRSGDSLRHVHWASTARTGKLLVREFEQETQPLFNLALNLCANWRSPQQFELAVCAISSLCYFSYQSGRVPKLLLNPDFQSGPVMKLMFDLPADRTGLDELLEILARIEPLPADAEGQVSSFEFYQDGIPFLAVLPSMEQVIMSFTGKGDLATWPEEIGIFDDDALAGILQDATGRLQPMKKRALVGGSDLSVQEKAPRSTASAKDIINVVHWEGDLELL